MEASTQRMQLEEEKLKQISILTFDITKVFKIGTKLSSQTKEDLITFLKKYEDSIVLS